MSVRRTQNPGFAHIRANTVLYRPDASAPTKARFAFSSEIHARFHSPKAISHEINPEDYPTPEAGTYVPMLDFSDARNSMYQMMGWI